MAARFPPTELAGEFSCENIRVAKSDDDRNSGITMHRLEICFLTRPTGTRSSALPGPSFVVVFLIKVIRPHVKNEIIVYMCWCFAGAREAFGW